MNPKFQALEKDWPTVIAALRHYREYLADVSEPDEEKELLIYDQIDNLDRLIPSFEKQLTQTREAPALFGPRNTHEKAGNSHNDL